MPIAVRYTQDAFSRSCWLWPVDSKGEMLKATSYMAVFFFLVIHVPPKSTLFPYTTLFRSRGGLGARAGAPAVPSHHRWESSLAEVPRRSEEHTSELQSQFHLVCRLLLEKKKMVTVCPSQFATRRTLFHVLVGCGLLILKVRCLKLPVIWLFFFF